MLWIKRSSGVILEWFCRIIVKVSTLLIRLRPGELDNDSYTFLGFIYWFIIYELV